MEAGDYLLMNGTSVMIKRVSDHFVVLDSGHNLTHEQAARFKCSSTRPDSVYTTARRAGCTRIAKQLGLL